MIKPNIKKKYFQYTFEQHQDKATTTRKGKASSVALIFQSESCSKFCVSCHLACTDLVQMMTQIHCQCSSCHILLCLSVVTLLSKYLLLLFVCFVSNVSSILVARLRLSVSITTSFHSAVFTQILISNVWASCKVSVANTMNA